MDQEEISRFEPFFGKWYIEEQIGQGGFGSVYRIKWTDYDGEENYSALKIISVPTNQAELKETQAVCGSPESTRRYYDDIVKRFKNEIDMMKLLRGHSNIVFYEDHEIIPKAEGQEPGYDILVRMELLTDLKQLWLEENEKIRRPEEVVRIGCDIAMALEVCQEHSVIHRDIKPANILRSRDGIYKLGDFGVARTLEHGQAYTRLGTENFIAPEVYNDMSYDYRADIYSLGMVLYYLLNNYRGPFLPQEPAVPTAEDYACALVQRMKGEKLPLPANAPGELGAIICKACAFLPEERYANARSFRNALAAVEESEKTRLPGDSLECGDGTPMSKERTPGKKKAYAATLGVGVGAIVLAAAVLGIVKEWKEKQGTEENFAGLVLENKTRQNTPESESETIPIPSVPILQGEVTATAVEPGQSLRDSVLELSGIFYDEDSGEEVRGSIVWDEPDRIMRESMECGWSFYPEDTKRCTALHEIEQVTVLLPDMLVGVQEVESVKDKASLVKVDLSSCGLTDLDILDGAVNLQYLILDNNMLEDISALERCPKLIFVSLVDNPDLKDVSVLYQLKYLEIVYWDGTGVSEVEQK